MYEHFKFSYVVDTFVWDLLIDDYRDYIYIFVLTVCRKELI